MTQIAYVNGRYVPQSHAEVHIEDRGYQFADGIYEVMAMIGGRLIDEEPHLDRLERSAAALEIAMPMSRAALKAVIRELISRNTRTDGTLYLQLTRGVAKRDHAFPKACHPALVMTLTGSKFPKAHEREKGVAVVTVPDMRWTRCDIKSVSLLANILAKQVAARAGVREAWMLEGEMVTEGSSSNAYIVTQAGEVRTHPSGAPILSGIVRQILEGLAREEGTPLVEKPFTLAEALGAREAFLTSTTAGVLPVVSIDGTKVGDGAPGLVTRALMARYDAHVETFRG